MNIEELQAVENRLEGALGKAFLSERVVMRGKDLHHELAQRDWLNLLVFAITGREFSAKQLRYMNFMWVATSYPDASIWPNQAAALGGSARTTPSLSLVAGIAISEARIYGRKPDRRVLDFFYRAAAQLDEGATVAEVVEREVAERTVVYGYGRPLVRLDERVAHTLNFIEELGFEKGRHFNIALDVHRYLKQTRGLSINIGAVYASTMADMGFSPEEYQLFLTMIFSAGMIPCYLDARRRPEGSFFPASCENLIYDGVAARPW